MTGDRPRFLSSQDYSRHVLDALVINIGEESWNMCGECHCPDPWCPTRGYHDEEQFGPHPVNGEKT